MMKSVSRKIIGVSVDPAVAMRIDEVANRAGLTTAAAARMCLLDGLGVVEGRLGIMADVKYPSVKKDNLQSLRDALDHLQTEVGKLSEPSPQSGKRKA